MSLAIYAAGALCWREINGKMNILVIHRSAYGDVTLPKGKVDPGESLPQTAAREIEEETGLKVALGLPLGETRYMTPNGRDKVVHYWAAEVGDKAIARSTFKPNSEVAALEWVTLKKARSYLSYPQDLEILDAFENFLAQGITSTFSLLVTRHAKAVAKSDSGRDEARPLTLRGVEQANALAYSLSAWRPKRIISSTALRCVMTVTPLAVRIGRITIRTDEISQDAWENGTANVRKIIGNRVRAVKTVVLCSHGPVISDILREIALATGTPMGQYIQDASELEVGGFSVVHLSLHNPGSGIIAIETHPSRV